MDDSVEEILALLVNAHRERPDNKNGRQRSPDSAPEGRHAFSLVCIFYCVHESRVVRLHPRFGEIERERGECTEERSARGADFCAASFRKEGDVARGVVEEDTLALLVAAAAI